MMHVAGRHKPSAQELERRVREGGHGFSVEELERVTLARSVSTINQSEAGKVALERLGACFEMQRELRDEINKIRVSIAELVGHAAADAVIESVRENANKK